MENDVGREDDGKEN